MFAAILGITGRCRLNLEEIINIPELSVKDLPRVLKGKGFGIVENCGGVWGLEKLVEAFKKKKGDSYEQFRGWLETDDFDITEFDIDDINFRLKSCRPYTQKNMNGNHILLNRQST
jgi:hypothetical protein